MRVRGRTARWWDRRVVIGVAVATVIALPASAAGGDGIWQTRAGDTLHQPQASLSLDLVEHWTATPKTNFEPWDYVAVDDRTIVLGAPGDGRSILLALDLATGAELWRHEDSMLLSDYRDGLVHGCDLALDPQGIVWTTSIADPSLGVEDSAVVVGIDSRTGEIVHRLADVEGGPVQLFCDETPVRMVGSTAVFTTMDEDTFPDGLIGVDASGLAWHLPLAPCSGPSFPIAVPPGQDDHFHAVFSRPVGGECSGGLLRVDAATGTVTDTGIRPPQSYGIIADAAGGILVETFTGTTHRYDLASGSTSPQWTNEAMDVSTVSGQLITGRGETPRAVTAFDLQTGEELWVVGAPDDDAFARPVMDASDRTAWAVNAGNDNASDLPAMSVFDADGTLVASIPQADGFDSLLPLAIAPDGTLIAEPAGAAHPHGSIVALGSAGGAPGGGDPGGGGSGGGSTGSSDVFGDPRTTTRLGSDDPVATAIDLSNLRFAGPGMARRVVLSRDDVFADALAGSPLTADGPMLFTNKDVLTPATRQEIDRVLGGSGSVFLLGGPNAISEGIRQELEAAGYFVSRLHGPNRVATSLSIAGYVWGTAQDTHRTVAIARADGPGTAGWADSVSGGGWAADQFVPIIVNPTGALDSGVDTWLRNNAPDEVVLFGGPNAISETVEAQVANSRRVFGRSRDATAAAISRELWGIGDTGPRRFLVINGRHEDGWLFGLAAAGFAADEDAPIVYVEQGLVPDATRLLVQSCEVVQVDLAAIGGEGVIPTQRLAELDAEDGRPC